MMSSKTSNMPRAVRRAGIFLPHRVTNPNSGQTPAQEFSRSRYQAHPAAAQIPSFAAAGASMIAAIAVVSLVCSIGPGTAAGYAIAAHLFPGAPHPPPRNNMAETHTHRCAHK